MFQFTTTHVINSDKDLTTGKDLWKAGENTLTIKGINTLKKANVTSIYKVVGKPEQLAKATINLGDTVFDSMKEGDILRLDIYIRPTESDHSSYYANDLNHKGRPFTVEFPWITDTTPEDVTTAQQATAKNLAKLINKYGLLMFGDKLLTVEWSGETVVLTATTEFQRFHVIDLYKFVDNGGNVYANEWEKLPSTGVITINPKGEEGFGTYSYIMRNIKLPTTEHLRAFAPKQNEMPIPGALYNQYTIEYCVNRGTLGTNAVGDQVTSVTHVVLFVKNDLATKFETALDKIKPEAGIQTKP